MKTNIRMTKPRRHLSVPCGVVCVRMRQKSEVSNRCAAFISFLIRRARKRTFQPTRHHWPSLVPTASRYYGESAGHGLAPDLPKLKDRKISRRFRLVFLLSSLEEVTTYTDSIRFVNRLEVEQGETKTR